MRSKMTFAEVTYKGTKCYYIDFKGDNYGEHSINMTFRKSDLKLLTAEVEDDSFDNGYYIFRSQKDLMDFTSPNGDYNDYYKEAIGYITRYVKSPKNFVRSQKTADKKQKDYDEAYAREFDPNYDPARYKKYTAQYREPGSQFTNRFLGGDDTLTGIRVMGIKAIRSGKAMDVHIMGPKMHGWIRPVDPKRPKATAMTWYTHNGKAWVPHKLNNDGSIGGETTHYWQNNY